MFALRNFSVLKQSVLQQGIKPTTGQCFRSLCTTTHEVQRDNDMPVQMENPYKIPQKGCILCNTPIDYRNIQLLSQFISPHTGRIYGRHITGLCSRKQKQISKAIKRAQAMGYMSVTLKHPQLMKDPNICDIRHLE